MELVRKYVRKVEENGIATKVEVVDETVINEVTE